MVISVHIYLEQFLKAFFRNAPLMWPAGSRMKKRLWASGRQGCTSHILTGGWSGLVSVGSTSAHSERWWLKIVCKPVAESTVEAVNGPRHYAVHRWRVRFLMLYTRGLHCHTVRKRACNRNVEGQRQRTAMQTQVMSHRSVTSLKYFSFER